MLVLLLSLTSRSLLPFLVVSKVQLLEEGIAERIEALLRSESPPVQFKLLGTLRMLADGQGRHLWQPSLGSALNSPPPLPCKQDSGLSVLLTQFRSIWRASSRGCCQRLHTLSRLPQLASEGAEKQTTWNNPQQSVREWAKA